MGKIENLYTKAKGVDEMGKIEKFLHSLPLRWAFMFYVAVFALCAVFLSAATRRWANNQIVAASAGYLVDISDASITEISENIIIYKSADAVPILSENTAAVRRYQAVSFFAPVLWSILCLICSALLFYRFMLKEPLRLLGEAASHIAENDMDFHIVYNGYNEMALLCRSFEKMRASLDSNTRKMAGMIEQRKRLNDAYTHELRTPVAILRGYADMILKYFPKRQMSEEELLNHMQIMSEHIARIDAFTDSMNTVQKLDDLAVTRRETNIQPFFRILKDTADVLCRSRGISVDFQNNIKESSFAVDSEAVLQVFENLLGNALRFAKKQVWIVCSIDDGRLQMAIRDDGRGFSEKDLQKAGMCYYSGKGTDGSYHFGLGLYIAALLCEKHGGSLRIANAGGGGADLAASFRIDFSETKPE